MAKRIGRRKGSRTKGFFFRAGRGWYSKLAGKFTPLAGPDGERLRDQDTDPRILREAHARQLLAVSVESPSEKVPESAALDTEVGAVCAAYLDHLKTQAKVNVCSGCRFSS